MNWGVAGLVYAAAYGAVVAALGGQPQVRLLIGNLALLMPPVTPLVVAIRRREEWRGRQTVFIAAIAAWAALWLVGQIAWFIAEVGLHEQLPWFHWFILLQLCGSALPLIAIVAWPHHGARSETASTAAIDIAVLVFLTGFLYWSLVIAPGMDAVNAAFALQALAY